MKKVEFSFKSKLNFFLMDAVNKISVWLSLAVSKEIAISDG